MQDWCSFLSSSVIIMEHPVWAGGGEGGGSNAEPACTWKLLSLASMSAKDGPSGRLFFTKCAMACSVGQRKT